MLAHPLGIWGLKRLISSYNCIFSYPRKAVYNITMRWITIILFQSPASWSKAPARIIFRVPQDKCSAINYPVTYHKVGFIIYFPSVYLSIHIFPKWKGELWSSYVYNIQGGKENWTVNYTGSQSFYKCVISFVGSVLLIILLNQNISV